MTSKNNSDVDSTRKFNSPYSNGKSFRSISLGSKKNLSKDGDTFDRTTTNRLPTKMRSQDDREKRNSTGSKSSSTRTSDRKSFKSIPSMASSARPGDRKQEVTAKNCNTTRKIEFPEGSVSLLTMAAEKQRQVIQMLQREKSEFRAKTEEKNGGKTEPKEIYELGLFFSSADGSVLNLDESYRNYLDEILHVWINLFYFIINLRINLIKILNRSGMENFVPNVKAETEIITKAAESVQLLSTLKIKSVSDALERFSDGEKKKEPEASTDRENVISSSFVNDMEYVGNEAMEMANRIKKLNEKMH